MTFFPSLKQNFIAYRSSKVSSRPDCIFEIHQLCQSGFSRVYSKSCCSCSFEREIIKIGQSSHKMYSNNVLNFQESTTILNACIKNVWKLIEFTTYQAYIVQLQIYDDNLTRFEFPSNYTIYIYIYIKTCTHTHTLTHSHTRIYIYIYIYAPIDLHMYMERACEIKVINSKRQVQTLNKTVYLSLHLYFRDCYLVSNISHK